MKIDVFGLSDVGMRREKNEDSFLVNKDLSLFVVADGMGGHVGGERASKLAVETIERIFSHISEDSEPSFLEEIGLSPDDVPAQIRHAIQTASYEIFDEAQKDPTLRGMGTTSVAMIVRNDRVYMANVGDSRGYLIRDNEIVQLTQDHSLVGEQLRAGVISADAAKEHKLKNIITRSVGFQEEVEIDIVVKVPKEGDRYLLCSDGLTNMIDDEEMLEIIKENGIEESCHILVDMANARGGDDNITLVLSEFSDIPEVNEEDYEDESTIGI